MKTKLRSIVLFQKIIILVIFILPVVGFSCEVCRGNPDSALAAGMDMAILTLLGVIGCVLSGFVSFFLYLKRKSLAYQMSRDNNSSI